MTQTLDAKISSHLDDLLAKPDTPLDQRLFEEAELVIPDQISQDKLLALVQKLSALLQTIRQDPSPAVDLLIRLLDGFTFADILAFEPPVNFVSGLASEEWMRPFNRLMLCLLRKATAKPSDAATVASWPEVVRALVGLWLCTGDTGVASMANTLLLDLLATDREIKPQVPDQQVVGGGQGLMWKRIFGDRDVYGTLFGVCSSKGDVGRGLSKNQRTVAQARLLEWIPKVAKMDWNAVARSHHSDVEERYSVTGGVLDFAALSMVDYKDDVLMYCCLIDFYSELLDATLPRDEDPAALIDPETSQGLVYMVTKGLHARTTDLYLQQAGHELDAMESMFLYGPAANYIATYASLYPKHFVASQTPRQVNERLVRALDRSAAKWAHAESPKHDLHLLASLPRTTLLDGSGNWSSSPLSLLPSKSTNPDVLNTLATIFHGPPQTALTFPAKPSVTDTSEQEQTEAAAARALYMHYLANNQAFWKDITTHADTVALKELALAAISCLTAVITANWSPKPDTTLPSSIIVTPESGHLTILTPPALEYTLPYILKPAQSFANLVGGRGDTESAAYQIATAKFGALRALHDKVTVQVEKEPGQGYEEILATLDRRLTEGPMSREGQVGGQIATMEM